MLRRLEADYYILQESDPNFKSIRDLEREGKTLLDVKANMYNCTYAGTLPNKDDSSSEILEGLFYTFNVNRPEDFCSHSLSVGDVVILNRGLHKTAYYCDSMGFRMMPPEFVKEFFEPKYLIFFAEGYSDLPAFVFRKMGKEYSFVLFRSKKMEVERLKKYSSLKDAIDDSLILGYHYSFFKVISKEELKKLTENWKKML